MERRLKQHDIKQRVLAFYNCLAADTEHRYRSWEHCFQHFSRRPKISGSKDRDIAAVHLAFYLASWGMYRGSSVLLWKDYTIHKSVVRKLLDSKYDGLYCAAFSDPSCDEDAAKLILSLSQDVKQIYRSQINKVNGKPRVFNPSDTLLTKVLLGTLGCCPACDAYFIKGFRRKGLKYSRFGLKLLRRVFVFYRANEKAFHEAQRTIRQLSGFFYPVMKLVDMYFWQIGVAKRTMNTQRRAKSKRAG